MSSNFFNNDKENALFDKFKGILNESQSNLAHFYAVTAYFYAPAYLELQPFLKERKKIKILAGIRTDKFTSDYLHQASFLRQNNAKVVDLYKQHFQEDWDNMEYVQEREQAVNQFLDDIISQRLELRLYTNRKVHAKFYLFLPENHTEHSDGWVIMGSSNLTPTGIGLKQPSNYELNVALKNYDDINYVKQEFKKLWENSVELKPEIAKIIKENFHVHYSPYEIYIKLLIEHFGDRIDYHFDLIPDFPDKRYDKIRYQFDAVNEGYEKLLKYDGFFLADVVGLGKTMIATMIAKRFILENGKNTKILVVHPPPLEENWVTFFNEFAITGSSIQFISNGSLHKLVGEKKERNYADIQEYDLVIIDEAHKYRNSSTQTFEKLQKICKSGRQNRGKITGNNKKIILISATPINNTPKDILSQLALFQDIKQSKLKITNLERFFAPIITEYNKLIKSKEEADKQDNKNGHNQMMDETRKILEPIRTQIISEITVRRTRSDITNHAIYRDDLKKQKKMFPEVAKIQKIEYALTGQLEKIFYTTLAMLENEDSITYSRYQIETYLINQEYIEHDYSYSQAVSTSKQLVKLLKTSLIKRLESSFEAFRISLEGLLAGTQLIIRMLENDRIVIHLKDIKKEIEKLIDTNELYFDQDKILAKQDKIYKKEDFKPDLYKNLKKDERNLKKLIDEWREIGEKEIDPKFDAFFEQLNQNILDSQKNPSGKLIIFTESNDTANYLVEKLRKKQVSQQIFKISSQNSKPNFRIIRENFDPTIPKEDQKNDIQILISTDVLAEGVNLHRANSILNYDTPWNPTKLIQRSGRINRIGTKHSIIYNYVIYPSEKGDREINLYKKTLVKLQGLHTTYGEDEQIFSVEEVIENFELFNTKEEINPEIKYLEEIRKIKETDIKEFERIKNIPQRSRTTRQNSKAVKNQLKNGTITFLKSEIQPEGYYLINENKEVKSLYFHEIASYFKADKQEMSYKQESPAHYDAVILATKYFDEVFKQIEKEKIKEKNQIESKEIKYLKGFYSLFVENTLDNQKYKEIIDQFISFLNTGKYANLKKEIAKMQKENPHHIDQIREYLVTFEKKYPNISDFETEKKDQLPIKNPQIILSESFMD